MIRFFDTEFCWEPGCARYDGDIERTPHAPNARIESIACVDARLSRTGQWSFDLFSVEPNMPEEQRVTQFVASWNETKPQLVSFAGRSSDIPLLLARMMRHGIQSPAFVRHVVGAGRYDARSGHQDLHDVLGMFGAQRKGGLNDWARSIGWPGKLEVDGSDVLDLILSGQHNKVHAYCLQDVVQTAAVYLRFAFTSGKLTLEAYESGAIALLEAAMKVEATRPIAELVDRSLWLNCSVIEKPLRPVALPNEADDDVRRADASDELPVAS